MLILTDRSGNKTEDPIITDIQKAVNDLFISKDVKDTMQNFVSLMNSDELMLQIYPQTIVLQDFGRFFPYDGPGGPGELLRIRYKEGSVFDMLEEIVNLLDSEEREKLIDLLNVLPNPE